MRFTEQCPADDHHDYTFWTSGPQGGEEGGGEGLRGRAEGTSTPNSWHLNPLSLCCNGSIGVDSCLRLHHLLRRHGSFGTG